MNKTEETKLCNEMLYRNLGAYIIDKIKWEFDYGWALEQKPMKILIAVTDILKDKTKSDSQILAEIRTAVKNGMEERIEQDF